MWALFSVLLKNVINLGLDVLELINFHVNHRPIHATSPQVCDGVTWHTHRPTPVGLVLHCIGQLATRIAFLSFYHVLALIA